MWDSEMLYCTVTQWRDVVYFDLLKITEHEELQDTNLCPLIFYVPQRPINST